MPPVQSSQILDAHRRLWVLPPAATHLCDLKSQVKETGKLHAFTWKCGEVFLAFRMETFRTYILFIDSNYLPEATNSIITVSIKLITIEQSGYRNVEAPPKYVPVLILHVFSSVFYTALGNHDLIRYFL